MNSRKASIDYDIEFGDEEIPRLMGSLQEDAEAKPFCRIEDHYDKLQWVPSILACVPETFENIIGIKSLSYLVGGIPLSGFGREFTAYTIGALGFIASLISSGHYVKTGITAIRDLIKGETPEDWSRDLTKRHERIAKILGCLCVIPSSLYDCFSTVYCAKQLHLSESTGYTLAGLAWFSNISSEGIESYGNIRDLVLWFSNILNKCLYNIASEEDKNEMTTTMKALYYGAGGTLGVLGAIQDAIEVYCPVVALAKAPYGSSLQQLILCGAIPKILTSNFYVGQWSRDAIKDFAERVEKKNFSFREKLTFCFSFFYAFVLSEAKRGLTTSFLKSPGAELPFTLTTTWIEIFGGAVMLRELVNNTKFIYPMVNELIDYYKTKRNVKPIVQSNNDLSEPFLSVKERAEYKEGEYYSNQNSHTLFQPINPRLANGHPVIAIIPPTLISERDENAKALPAATKSAARV